MCEGIGGAVEPQPPWPHYPMPPVQHDVTPASRDGTEGETGTASHHPRADMTRGEEEKEDRGAGEGKGGTGGGTRSGN